MFLVFLCGICPTHAVRVHASENVFTRLARKAKRAYNALYKVAKYANPAKPLGELPGREVQARLGGWLAKRNRQLVESVYQCHGCAARLRMGGSKLYSFPTPAGLFKKKWTDKKDNRDYYVCEACYYDNTCSKKQWISDIANEILMLEQDPTKVFNIDDICQKDAQNIVKNPKTFDPNKMVQKFSEDLFLNYHLDESGKRPFAQEVCAAITPAVVAEKIKQLNQSHQRTSFHTSIHSENESDFDQYDGIRGTTTTTNDNSLLREASLKSPTIVVIRKNKSVRVASVERVPAVRVLEKRASPSSAILKRVRQCSKSSSVGFRV